MIEKPQPLDVIVWTIGRDRFELRTLATGLLERVDGTWTEVFERARSLAVRRRSSVWKQERHSYHRVWTYSEQSE
jgi:hypothetical protein